MSTGGTGRTRRRAKPRLRDVDALLDTMVSGFVDDPLYEWLYPDRRVRPARLRPGFELILRSGFDRGVVAHTEGLDAVAIWTEPGVELLDESDMEAWLEQLRRDAPARADAALAGMAACAAHQPSEPHWTLHSIVVALQRQGRGLGSGLLRSTIEAVEATGAPAYLESSNIRNVSAYERVGFAVIAAVPLQDGPIMRPMLRSPTSVPAGGS